MDHTESDFVITHPEGYDLNPEIVGNNKVSYNQEEALHGADVVYVKNWCSYTNYGAILRTDDQWMMTPEKMNAPTMLFLCTVYQYDVMLSLLMVFLDDDKSLVIEQAKQQNLRYASSVAINC